jgi:hypothetical protein
MRSSLLRGLSRESSHSRGGARTPFSRPLNGAKEPRLFCAVLFWAAYADSFLEKTKREPSLVLLGVDFVDRRKLTGKSLRAARRCGERALATSLHTARECLARTKGREIARSRWRKKWRHPKRNAQQQNFPGAPDPNRRGAPGYECVLGTRDGFLQDALDDSFELVRSQQIFLFK